MIIRYAVIPHGPGARLQVLLRTLSYLPRRVNSPFLHFTAVQGQGDLGKRTTLGQFKRRTCQARQNSPRSSQGRKYGRVWSGRAGRV